MSTLTHRRSHGGEDIQCARRLGDDQRAKGCRRASVLHSNLALRCDCVQPSVHAGTSNVPEGWQELSLIQLFRDFSYCGAERVKALCLVTPTSTIAQPGFTMSSNKNRHFGHVPTILSTAWLLILIWVFWVVSYMLHLQNVSLTRSQTQIISL